MQDIMDSKQPHDSVTVNVDLIRQLIEPNDQLISENAQLRKIIEGNNAVIDQLTNSMAFQKELIQQLRDEIAILKGQKPKPKIPPSRLEGPKSKKKWHERFKKDLKSERFILFASRVNNFLGFITRSGLFSVSKIANANSVLQISGCGISRLAKRVFKKSKL